MSCGFHADPTAVFLLLKNCYVLYLQYQSWLFCLAGNVEEEELVDSGEESDVEAIERSAYEDEVPYPSARMLRSSEAPSDLPTTVEVLSTHDGCRVYLVGTAHFSESSQQDVTKVHFCR